jgi:hypothetical protein
MVGAADSSGHGAAFARSPGSAFFSKLVSSLPSVRDRDSNSAREAEIKDQDSDSTRQDLRSWAVKAAALGWTRSK